jgi:hypothetical protein
VIFRELGALAPSALLYFALIAVIALVAVCSSKPPRRKAALAVLALLVRRRDRGPEVTRPQIRDATSRRPADPPNPPPPNP